MGMQFQNWPRIVKQNYAMNCQTINEQVVKLKHNVLIDPELEELQLAAR